MGKEGTNHSSAGPDYQACSAADPLALLHRFKTCKEGLVDHEHQERIAHYGYNEPVKKKRFSLLRLVVSKFINPLILILFTIVIFSLLYGEKLSAMFVTLMILISIIIDVSQEFSSNKAVEELNALVRSKATVIRDGKKVEVDIRDIVPGDIVDLAAGALVPADIRIIESKDIFVNQSSLTGESFPVEKHATVQQKDNAAVMELENLAFMGSSVISGTGLGVVIATGASTQFGQISQRLSEKAAETGFDKGIRQFTMLMIKLIAMLVIGIFVVITLFKHGSVKEAMLFSLAVAVGLTPEMLPMMVTINLSKGARDMAKKKVVVKKLDSIQNLGAMDILCTDKTGTLTMDEIVLEQHTDIRGKDNADVLQYVYLNSKFQTGLKNVMDLAVLKHTEASAKGFEKVDEVPFDFNRRLMTVIVQKSNKHILITKGAPEEVFKRCKQVILAGKTRKLDKKTLQIAQAEYERMSAKGLRVLAVAHKKVAKKKKRYDYDDEKDLVLMGFAAFLDPPKQGVTEIITSLNGLGVEIKILTGDNERVTEKICRDVGLASKGTITGPMVEKMEDQALKIRVEQCTIFARLTPMQKERIILALQQNGHVVGYMGDGINDAPSLGKADVGISVNNAVDVAKESANIILLEKSLMVLQDGVIDGRKTFGNIVKYIKMGASSNFGNMISMAGATVFLPFLPMLPVQVLFNNFLYDLSNLALPTDKVDDEYWRKPKPWKVDFIKKFMLFIGPLSSIFDFLTFAVMWFVFQGWTLTPQAQAVFHTGWFIESLFTQTLIIHVIRTNKIPFLESRPSWPLLLSTILVLSFAVCLPFTPLGGLLQFAKLPWLFFVILGCMVFAYVALVHTVKTWLVRANPDI